MNNSRRVRVRFAPSPTGFLHIGGLRTAFYNYLFAKHHHGDFILRIEDTDQQRKTEGAVEQLLRTMKLFQIEPDEGPVLQDDGSVEEFGSFGPYIQSKRLSLYLSVANKLTTQGDAYYCFCTQERLETLRNIQQKKGLPTKYDGFCRNLTKQEVDVKLQKNEPHVLRLKMPKVGMTELQDIVRGKVSFTNSLIDDQVLVKSDGFPTYHLANVVDDHEMKITHVIRGEEWLSSVPKHLRLYHVLGWEVPAMAHLPILLDEHRAKLSKRKGAVSAEEYVAKGILPDALLNFLLLLGWNPKTEQEVFTRDEMIQLFSLEQVNSSGASVSPKKLSWMNKEYLKKISANALDNLIRKNNLLPDAWLHAAQDSKFWFNFLDLLKDRLETLESIEVDVSYFFEDPKLQKNMLRGKNQDSEDTKKLLIAYKDLLQVLRQWNSKSIKEKTEEWLAENNIKRGELLWPVRVALTGKQFSPGTYELLGVFSKDVVLHRLEAALKELE